MPSDVGASTSARRQPSTTTGFGGRRIQVSRPRIRSTEGTEAVFPSVAAWRKRDPLTARVLEQIVLGVSARGVCRQPGAGAGGGPEHHRLDGGECLRP